MLNSANQPDLALVAAGFASRLREAGISVSVDRTARMVNAVSLIGPASVAELYWCVRIALLGDIEELPVFDSVFLSVFGSDSLKRSVTGEVQVEGANEIHSLPKGDEESGHSHQEPKTSTASSPSSSNSEGQTDLGQFGLRTMATADEAFSQRSLAEMNDEERKIAEEIVSAFAMSAPTRLTRRSSSHGMRPSVDVRRTVRKAVRTGGDPVKLITSGHSRTQRRVVVIVDISGSMEPFAQLYVHFMHCLSKAIDSESFVFATRLSRITNELGTNRIDDAITRASEVAKDRFGGTRIADALRGFIEEYGRRGMARGAVIVIASDGWECGDPERLGEQMRRLSLLANRIIWVNPRSAAKGYQPLTGGMSAALPYCDVLLGGQSLAGLRELCDYVERSVR